MPASRSPELAGLHSCTQMMSGFGLVAVGLLVLANAFFVATEFAIVAVRRSRLEQLAASGGDGWIIIVEFGDMPRAYSVLAYGESAREESPNHSDQAAMFARGELKRVAFKATADRMLTLARLDNGSTHREYEVVNLAELAQKGVRRAQALAEQRGSTVSAENINTPYVIGRPILLEQALLVLLDNAIKYNRDGGRVIVRTEARGGQALVEVCDTGVGIAAEHMPHLGEHFYRVDKARSLEAGGTGLGLSIARSIAAAHEGRLRISSIPEQGTTVMIVLPLAILCPAGDPSPPGHSGLRLTRSG